MICTHAAAPSNLCFSVALLLLLLPVYALGQALPSVPNDVKSSNEVSGQRGEIEKFISMATAQLASESAEAQKAARDALQREALVNGQPNASAAYLNLYTQLLNQQLVNLSKNPAMRVRLNAAIVTYTVSKIANDPNLVPAATAFINDQAPAVVLWGVKAGRSLVPAQLRAFGGSGGQQLAPAIVAAAKKHSKGTVGGAIAVDAYDALTLDISDPARAKIVKPAMIQAVIPHVHDLMAFRIGEFQKGVPPEPGADQTASSFLVHPSVWPVQTPQQQARTMQLLSDLITLAALQAPTLSAADQAYLIRIIQRVGSSIRVAAQNAGENGIVQAAQPVAEPQRGVTAAQIARLVQAIYPAIKASKAFAGTTQPPPLLGNAPPPPPASAPTTGPVAIPGASGLPPLGVAAHPGAATRPSTRAAPKAPPAPPPAPRTPPPPAPRTPPPGR